MEAAEELVGVDEDDEGDVSGCSIQGEASRLGPGVGLTLIWKFHSSCPAAQPVLPLSHQLEQNQADSGIAELPKSKLTQPRSET